MQQAQCGERSVEELRGPKLDAELLARMRCEGDVMIRDARIVLESTEPAATRSAAGSASTSRRGGPTKKGTELR
jgi:hypothetical protein